MTKGKEDKTAAAEPKKAEQKTCFIIGPIGNENSETRDKADLLMDLVIGPAFEGLGYEVERADDIPTPGMIDSQVINKVLDADLVIADLTGHNPNAFYELGLRHAAAKPVIHICEAGSEIPFDIKVYRAVLYSLVRPAAYKKAKAELKKQVEAVNQENYTVDNPVVRARGRQEYRETLPDPQKSMFDMIDGISRRMASLEMNQGPLRLAGHIEGSIKVRYFDKYVSEERRVMMGNVLSYAAFLAIRTGGVSGGEDIMDVIIIPPNTKEQVIRFIEWIKSQTWVANVEHNLF